MFEIKLTLNTPCVSRARVERLEKVMGFIPWELLKDTIMESFENHGNENVVIYFEEHAREKAREIKKHLKENGVSAMGIKIDSL